VARQIADHEFDTTISFLGFGATRGSVIPGTPEGQLFGHAFTTIVIGPHDRLGWGNVQQFDAKYRMVLQPVSLSYLVCPFLPVNKTQQGQRRLADKRRSPDTV